MRCFAVVSLLLVAGCMSQEPAPTTTPGTTPPGSPATSTPTATTARPATTTTAAPATTTTTTLPPLQGLAYEKIADLPFPVEMTSLPGAELSYVATKDGRVWAYDGSRVLEEPVLDISGQVRNRGEQGLLSIALHPEDPTRLFVHYSANDGDTVVSELAFTSALEVGVDSERVLLRLDQPARNHNGGMIMFGPDGLTLYLGLGDGGGANDRFGNGQNEDTLLGGLVTLRVDGDPEPALFAYGLRNPWRFWIDQGLVYIADVGQNSFEEVSVTELRQGLNFGWPITEGRACFRPPSGCDTEGLTLPVVEVSHGDAGTCSITGGIVYRGSAIPEIRGEYFYSDFCGGYLRSFHLEDGAAVGTDWTDQVGVAGSVSGFGIDGEGEMYVTTREELLKVVAVRG